MADRVCSLRWVTRFLGLVVLLFINQLSIAAGQQADATGTALSLNGLQERAIARPAKQARPERAIHCD